MISDGFQILSQYYYYDSTAAGVDLLFNLVCCVFFLALPVVGIILTIYVYKDAQKNKVDNPEIWALITFLGGLVGFLIYFFAAKNNVKSNSPSNNSSNNQDNSSGNNTDSPNNNQ